MERGFFITFEGGEGAGKSTQIARLAPKLRDRRFGVVVTREPGGSPGAEAVRHVLLSGAAEPLGPEMEALLFAAARSDHVEQVIRPAVTRGDVVLCDRFLDSSRVYQGLNAGVDTGFMQALETTAINGLMPDLTLLFDVDPELGLARAAARRGEGDADRFEKETLALHQERRRAFLQIAENEPQRCVVINGSLPVAEVEELVGNAVFQVLDARARAEPAEA